MPPLPQPVYPVNPPTMQLHPGADPSVGVREPPWMETLRRAWANGPLVLNVQNCGSQSAPLTDQLCRQRLKRAAQKCKHGRSRHVAEWLCMHCGASNWEQHRQCRSCWSLAWIGMVAVAAMECHDPRSGTAPCQRSRKRSWHETDRQGRQRGSAAQDWESRDRRQRRPRSPRMPPPLPPPVPPSSTGHVVPPVRTSWVQSMGSQ